MKAYYEERAREYDATSYELTLKDPTGASDLRALERLIAAVARVRVLDIGCGTGWLTRFIGGNVVGVDQSRTMLQLAAARVPAGVFVCAAVPPLPFLDRSFDIAFSSHVYGHLELPSERDAFLTEAFRVATKVIVVEQAWRPGVARGGWENRSTGGGTHHAIHKRYFTATELADEIGGRVLLDTTTFVAAVASRPPVRARLVSEVA